MDAGYTEYNAAATYDDGSCSTLVVEGCMDPAADNYNAAANTDDGSCLIPGCMIPVSACVSPTMDGYSYDVVRIGCQCWFAENLRTTTYADGTPIPDEVDEGDWSWLWTGASGVYGEGSEGFPCVGCEICQDYSPDVNACDSAQSLPAYGRHYNWYAVDDARGLCPTGWHVPTDGEWTDLENYITSQGFAEDENCPPLKTTTGWYDGRNGTDDFGFSAVPAGFRAQGCGAGWNKAGRTAYFWTSTSYGDPYDGGGCSATDGSAASRRLDDWFQHIMHQDIGPRMGYSVRCIKD